MILECALRNTAEPFDNILITSYTNGMLQITAHIMKYCSILNVKIWHFKILDLKHWTLLHLWRHNTSIRRTLMITIYVILTPLAGCFSHFKSLLACFVSYKISEWKGGSYQNIVKNKEANATCYRVNEKRPIMLSNSLPTQLLQENYPWIAILISNVSNI